MVKQEFKTCNLFLSIFIGFIMLQLLILSVSYESNLEGNVGRKELINEQILITFSNTSISDFEYHQLFEGFCQINSHQVMHIQNSRSINDMVGIFIPVLNVLTSEHLLLTLNQLSSASTKLKLNNSVTLILDESKESCLISKKISNMFMFDVKIGFLKFLRLPLIFKDFINNIETKKRKDNLPAVTSNGNKSNISKQYASQTNRKNIVDYSEINLNLLYIISHIFSNKFKYYLHLSASSRISDDYLSIMTTFLRKKEQTSRQSFYVVEFGFQEFLSGMAIRREEVKRFSKFLLDIKSGSSASLFFIYQIYLEITLQRQRILNLPPIFHSTDLNFEFIPDPNPLAKVFTSLQTIKDKDSILTEGGLIVIRPQSGDQIVILFSEDVILDSVQWNVYIASNHSHLATSLNVNMSTTNMLASDKEDVLEAFIEASSVFLTIDKKSHMAKCADYQLLDSFHNNQLSVHNLTRVIGHITTRCLKLTVVNDVNNVFKFDRISIGVLPMG